MEWQPIETAPEFVNVYTCRKGERGVNICWRRGDEWVEAAWQGRTTVTHHSFLPPTHWMSVEDYHTGAPHESP